jgi:hypothetical protein
MADAVATRVLLDNPTHYVAHFTNISDGTGESAVVKVDKSAIGVASDGAEAASLDIEKISWCCDGMAVRILFDAATDDLAMAVSGSGSIDFTDSPKAGIPGISRLQLKDPRSATHVGDVLFTTTGHTSGDTYNITLWLRKNPA